MINLICPYCEDESPINTEDRQETIDVRGEPMVVTTRVLHCTKCGKEFDDPSIENDSLAKAYTKYRDAHNLTQPEKLVELRKMYELTQAEFAELLGWGVATLSRYENGALQSDSNETLLQLIIEPQNYLRLLRQRRNVFDNQRFVQLESHALLLANKHWENYASFFAQQPGNENINLIKFINSVLLLSDRSVGVWKTKMNKLLFYADFKQFKDFGHSITQAGYLAYQFGPVPIYYDGLFGFMERVGLIQIEEIELGEATGERLKATCSGNESIFSAKELQTLRSIKDIFKNTSATDICEQSHREEAWKLTPNREIISYDYAAQLSI